jgi:hypothetical protein
MRDTDPAGHMWTETTSTPLNPRTHLRAGTGPPSSSARHSPTSARVNEIAFLTSATIRVNEGLTRFIDVGWDATSGTFAELFRPSSDGHGTVVPCELAGQLRSDTNTMVVRIPRTCLSSPRWIKVDAGPAFTDVSGTSYFVDAACTTASPDSRGTGDLSASRLLPCHACVDHDRFMACSQS